MNYLFSKFNNNINKYNMSSAANFPNLAALSVKVLSYPSNSILVQDLIQSFLDTETEVSYNLMVPALDAALVAFATGNNSSLRILLAISDGTVAYDSSRVNTYAAYTSNSINSSNHNTRPEIMVAILGNTGVGISSRYSRSVNSYLKYQATRFGSSTQSNLGTFRVSLNE